MTDFQGAMRSIIQQIGNMHFNLSQGSGSLDRDQVLRSLNSLEDQGVAALSQPPPTGDMVMVPREGLEEVRDLLMERIHGNPARSAGHNARLAVEDLLRGGKDDSVIWDVVRDGEPDTAIHTGVTTESEALRLADLDMKETGSFTYVNEVPAAPPSPAPGAEVRVQPRPHPSHTAGKTQEFFGFEGGSLTVKTSGHDVNGNGWLCFAEDDLEWEQDQETGKDYRILNLPNSELIFIRDKLNEVFPATPSPSDTAPLRLHKAIVWFQGWYFEHTGKRIFTRNASKAVEGVLAIALPTTPGADQ